MFYILVLLFGFVCGGIAGMAAEQPLTANQITEANMRCSLNEDLDHINARAGRATAVCTNGAVFILKEK